MRKYLFTIASRYTAPLDSYDREEAGRIVGAIGRILPGDMGKRCYDVGGVLQVENADQVKARELTYQAASKAGGGRDIIAPDGSIWRVSDWSARPSPISYGWPAIPGGKGEGAYWAYQELPGGCRNAR